MVHAEMGRGGPRLKILIGTLSVLAAAVALTACTPEESGGKGTALKFFIFNEPSGVLDTIAKDCSSSSGGSYNIQFEFLPSDADQQREQLVRRLGAEDTTIDIMGMDVIWTGEFANAGWVEEFTGDAKQAATEGVFPSVAETASFEDKLWAAPAWTNTQLLWYRKDRIGQPPKTWEEMYKQAEQLGKNNLIEVQANRYEGLMVWFNAMVESAGTSIVGPEDAQQVALDPAKTEEGLGLMVELAKSPFADPSFSTSTEDTARLAFEDGSAAFMLNYPFVFPSAKENAPKVFKQIATAPYPKVDPNKPSKPPLGGINLGVSSFSKNKQQAFEAIQCITQPQNQIKIAQAAGLPPVKEALYGTQGIKDAYPGFSDTLKQAVNSAAPRPVTPAYQDLTLAVQRTIHPLSDISDLGKRVEELRKNVEKALEREGLL